VFPARYELNSYIVFRKRLVSKRLMRAYLRQREVEFNYDSCSDVQNIRPRRDYSYAALNSNINCETPFRIPWGERDRERERENEKQTGAINTSRGRVTS
jgi:hypothetical protein